MYDFKYSFQIIIISSQLPGLKSLVLFSNTLFSYTYLTPMICHQIFCSVGLGCRIHQLRLCRGVRPHHECPDYDTKQSDAEVRAVLELWGMRSTLSLPSLPGSLWPGVVAPDKGPIYGLNRTKWWLEFTRPINGLNRTNGILMLNWTVWLNRIAWNINVFHN